MSKIFSKAKWLWHNKYNCANIYLNFYDTFMVEKAKSNYRLLISADTNYAVYINGIFIESGQYTDYPEYKVYDEIYINNAIHDGINELIIIGYWQGEDSFTYRKEPPGLIYELSYIGDILVSSSESTRVCLNSAYSSDGVEKVSGQLGYSFRYDSLMEPERTDMQYADIQEEKSYSFKSRPIKKLTIGEKLPDFLTVRGTFTDVIRKSSIGQHMQYASMAFKEPNIKQQLPNEEGIVIDGNSGNGVYAIIDTGEENTGYIEIDIDVPDDCMILIGWGEHLDDMRVRAYVGGRNFCASYKAKAGRNKFMHPFRRLGMRYMQLNVYAPSCTIYYAGIRPTIYPVSNNITFRCSDHLHNKIQDISVRTLLMCMHEHYEDCPWREQALYSMDSRNQMLCGYYAFKEYDFAKASIRLMALSKREDNLLEICSPARGNITIPSFTAVFLTQLWEYYQYSGDREFIIEMLPTALLIAEGFMSRLDTKVGLIPCYSGAEYWNFYEWQDGLSGSLGASADKITYDAPLNAFVAMGLRSVSKMYEVLNETCQSDYYMSKCIELCDSIDSIFWNDDKEAYASFLDIDGRLSHYCELTQSLIIFADACPEDKLDTVLSKLASNELISVTISHSIFKYDALMRDADKYGRFVFNQVADLWGKMLYNNATTFWETIDGASAFSNAGSLCHGWSAVPLYLYHKYALDIPEKCGLYECTVF